MGQQERGEEGRRRRRRRTLRVRISGGRALLAFLLSIASLSRAPAMATASRLSAMAVVKAHTPADQLTHHQARLTVKLNKSTRTCKSNARRLRSTTRCLAKG
eukprot:765948-Hanusia_phi.AAC.8